uniref:Uncharacterized protein n=1 Tax=Aegilops tauschii subsp. strangulata TaxID=200361 RepID=A0A453N0S1_AEGTS
TPGPTRHTHRAPGGAPPVIRPTRRPSSPRAPRHVAARDAPSPPRCASSLLNQNNRANPPPPPLLSPSHARAEPTQDPAPRSLARPPRSMAAAAREGEFSERELEVAAILADLPSIVRACNRRRRQQEKQQQARPEIPS